MYIKVNLFHPFTHYTSMFYTTQKLKYYRKNLGKISHTAIKLFYHSTFRRYVSSRLFVGIEINLP